MIKTINVTKEYEKELKHINKQHNQSRYLLELVRADMQKQNENEQIIEIVRQTLQGQNAMYQTSVNNNVNNVQNEKKKQGAMSLLG